MSDVSSGRMLSFSAFALAGMLVMFGTTTSAKIEQKNVQQERINQRLETHIQAYTGLEEKVAGWDEGYRDINQAKDLLGLYQALDLSRFGLRSNLDDFRVNDAKPYLVDDTPIGMVEVCMDSGQDGLEVTADSYSALLEGLEGIESSPDTRLNSVTITGGQARAKAIAGSVCMLLRDVNVR